MEGQELLYEVRGFVGDLADEDIKRQRHPSRSVAVRPVVEDMAGDVVGRVVMEWLRNLVDERGQVAVALQLRLDQAHLSRMVRGERSPSYKLVCAGVVYGDLYDCLKSACGHG